MLDDGADDAARMIGIHVQCGPVVVEWHQIDDRTAGAIGAPRPEFLERRLLLAVELGHDQGPGLTMILSFSWKSGVMLLPLITRPKVLAPTVCSVTRRSMPRPGG